MVWHWQRRNGIQQTRHDVAIVGLIWFLCAHMIRVQSSLRVNSEKKHQHLAKEERGSRSIPFPASRSVAPGIQYGHYLRHSRAPPRCRSSLTLLSTTGLMTTGALCLSSLPSPALFSWIPVTSHYLSTSIIIHLLFR